MGKHRSKPNRCTFQSNASLFARAAALTIQSPRGDSEMVRVLGAVNLLGLEAVRVVANDLSQQAGANLVFAEHLTNAKDFQVEHGRGLRRCRLRAGFFGLLAPDPRSYDRVKFSSKVTIVKLLTKKSKSLRLIGMF
jgi:hypothetical protein